jgi:hypothetical protein
VFLRDRHYAPPQRHKKAQKAQTFAEELFVVLNLTHGYITDKRLQTFFLTGLSVSSGIPRK